MFLIYHYELYKHEPIHIVNHGSIRKKIRLVEKSKQETLHLNMYVKNNTIRSLFSKIVMKN
jgi:hypothetical protein